MAALTATAWSETVSERRIEGKKRRNRVILTLDNAANNSAYPTSGGIPLPTTLGMTRNIDYVILYGVGHTSTGMATGMPVWTYAPTSHSVVGWKMGPTAQTAGGMLDELATTWTPTLAPYDTVLYVEAVGW